MARGVCQALPHAHTRTRRRASRAYLSKRVVDGHRVGQQLARQEALPSPPPRPALLNAAKCPDALGPR